MRPPDWVTAMPVLPRGLALACHVDGRETHPSDMLGPGTFMPFCNCVRCCEARGAMVVVATTTERPDFNSLLDELGLIRPLRKLWL